MGRFQPKPRPIYEAVYAAYMETAEPIAHLAKRLGVPARTIRRWRDEGNWPQRPCATSPKRPSKAAVARPHRRVPSKQAVVRRLWTAIDAALSRLEQAMTSGEPLTPADSERETRAIGALIRNLAKAAEFESHVGRETAADAKSASAADPEQLRQDLAERLRRIGGPVAGSPEGGADGA